MAKQSSRSTKRSAASGASRELLEKYVCYIDRSLECCTVIQALRAAGASVEPHSNHFAHDAPDEVWLSKSGEQGWLALSKDKAIRRRPLAKHAIRTALVRAFVLTSGNMTGHEMAQLLVENLSRMMQFAEENPAPFIASVTKSGVVPISLK